MTERPQHFDVIVVGAGLSGIDAGYHLQTYCPDKSYVIFEGRDAVGGTWDLFRYPGIRSDSDMYTFGYSFRPWESNDAIAKGEAIRTYIRETAEAYGIDRKIRFRHRVKSASWSSADALWTVEVERAGEAAPLRFTCQFLFSCTGYYDYAAGYTPQFAGVETFRGRVIHPQKWPEDLDYAGKRVVVIGSGATAITIIPAIAKKAAHVTMLQRSPSYVVSRPTEDRIAKWLRGHLPVRAAYALARWYNAMFALYFYNLSRRRPEAVKHWIVKQVREQLGPDYDVRTHFSPHYQPWDQRMCFAPDADFFLAIKAGTADVVTDEIDAFSETGIRLRSGRELPADIIVTATGLNLQMLGGMQLTVDGAPVKFSETMNFRGTMLSNVPNFATVFGYTNASWTLKSDLACLYFSRLIAYMDRNGFAVCTPRQRDPSITPQPAIDLSSGYFQRAIDKLPRQGSRKPWRLYQNYLLDFVSLRFGGVNDKALEFSRRDETRIAA